MDEVEDSLEREKKAKGDVEVTSNFAIKNVVWYMIDNMVFLQKLKRKIEGDLKLTQEAVSDLERVNAELSQTVQRKEKEVSSVSAKIEDEGTLGSKYGKQVKELQCRVDELDEGEKSTNSEVKEKS